MNTELDSRAILTKLIGRMSDTDVQQMLAYAAGYEAGRTSWISSHTTEQSNKITTQPHGRYNCL